MRIINEQFTRKPLTGAVMSALLGLSPSAFSATIYSVNEDNLSVPPVDGKTLVYTDTEGTASFGWLDPVNDRGTVGLGIAVYNEPFKAQNTYDFDGCIMAKPDYQPNPNCQAPPDSGKRFKLKETETNAPIDLVFNVSPDASSKLYRVMGKLSNLTDVANSVGGDLNGIRFETGFGVGNAFFPSSVNDGLSFGFGNDSAKLTIGNLGKSPGGLFGGSKAEGLPFFSTSISEFVESDATALDEDKTQTTGTTPTPYADLFGDWRTLSTVPTGWFYDHDGNPGNDSILLAWDDGAADWQTFEKLFDPSVMVDTNGDDTADTAADRWDPNSTNFDSAVAGDVGPLVATLDEGDPEGSIPDAISLRQTAASTLYDGSFKVLIDGAAVSVDLFADWANNPPKVNTSDGSLYATWRSDEGDAGMYEMAADGSFETLDTVNATIAAAAGTSAAYQRVPGYVQGPVDDLANVNINTTISVSDTTSWPTCTSDGTDTNCTFTLRVTGLNDVVGDPDIPVDTISSSDSSSSGCTAGTPGSPFDPVLPGMVLMALGGLWARKRLSNA